MLLVVRQTDLIQKPPTPKEKHLRTKRAVKNLVIKIKAKTKTKIKQKTQRRLLMNSSSGLAISLIGSKSGLTV